MRSRGGCRCRCRLGLGRGRGRGLGSPHWFGRGVMGGSRRRTIIKFPCHGELANRSVSELLE